MSQIVILILTLIGNIIIVRLLGASGKGTIALLQSYFSISAAILILGMSEGNIYYLGNQRFQHRDVFSSVIFHTIAISVIFMIFSVIAANWILSHFLKNINTEYYFTALCIFPALFFLLHTTTMLLGHKNIVGYNIANVSRYLLILLFQILLIPKYGIMGALVATVIGFIAADIAAVSFLSHYGCPTVFIKWKFFRCAFVYGAKSQLGLILNQIDRRLDVFIINLFLNLAQVGFYAIAVAMAELPWYISNAIATVLFPEVSGMKKKDAYFFTAFICRNTLFMVMCFSLILFFIGGIILKIVFGPQFVTSLTPLRLLIPGIVCISINKVLCAGFSGTGKPEYGTYTTVISAITTIALDFTLIPILGINGAAIASTIAYTFSAITGIFIFRKISGISLREFLIITRKDIYKYPSLYRKLIRQSKRA